MDVLRRCRGPLLGALTALIAVGIGGDATVAKPGSGVFDPQCGRQCQKKNLPHPGLVAEVPGGGEPVLDSSRSAALQAEAGAEWTRVSIDWAFLQPVEADEISPERLAIYDGQVRSAIEAGMKVMLTVSNSPGWSHGGVPPYAVAAPPDHLAAYRDFVEQLAAHFAPMDVHAYEIWNEPNLGIFWPAPDPRAYTALLKTAYLAIKSVDPGATVIAGSLAPVRDYSPVKFLRGMYAAGAKGYFDVLSAHVFPVDNPTDCRRQGRVPVGVKDFCYIEHFRKLQRANADKRPIWLTEFGYGTDGLGAVTRDQQADYLRRGFKLARRYRYLRKVFWFSFRDIPHPEAGAVGTWVNSSGLVTGDYAPKIAFAAYRRVASRLRELRSEATER